MAHTKTNLMKLIDDIKQQIPLQKQRIQTFITDTKSKMGAVTAKKDDPMLIEADKIMKRMHYLFSEESTLDLGKQAVFTRNVSDTDGKVRSYTYMVDFKDPNQIKRLRTLLLELADLSSPDASKAKRESIPGYLDYIAQASI